MLEHKETEVNPFLDLGIQIGLGAVVGGVGAAFGGLAIGAGTSGLAPVAGFMVLAGVRRFHLAKNIQHDGELLATEHEKLTSAIFPAVADVVYQNWAS